VRLKERKQKSFGEQADRSMLDIVQQEQGLGWFFANVLGNDYYHQEGNKAPSMAKFSQILQVVLADLAWLTGI